VTFALYLKRNFSIDVNGISFKVKGKGHKEIVCSHPNDIVLRKSNYVCDRTIAVNCDKGSDSISRKLVGLLQNPKTVGTLTIMVT